MPSTHRRRGEPANPKTCHERALGLLAVRPRSRRELERRLLAASFDRCRGRRRPLRLERVGLVDDQAFARQMADYQYGSRRAGRRAVTGALMEKGIAPEVIAQVIDDAPDDEDRARPRTRRVPSRAHGRPRSRQGLQPSHRFAGSPRLQPGRGSRAAGTALAVDRPTRGAASTRAFRTLVSGCSRPYHREHERNTSGTEFNANEPVSEPTLTRSDPSTEHGRSSPHLPAP